MTKSQRFGLLLLMAPVSSVAVYEIYKIDGDFGFIIGIILLFTGTFFLIND